MSYQLTVEQFLEDVGDHQLSIERDDGLYRHLRLKKPGTLVYWFEVLTWPGVLCIHGDCGTYVFSRLRDMFEFFRREVAVKPGETITALPINLGYWAEKVQAQDKCSPVEEFDMDRAIEIVQEELDDLKESDPLITTEKIAEAMQVIKSADRSSCGFQDAIRILSENHDIEFYDLFDHRFNEYTTRFRWCCYAIVWAIAQYDLATMAQEKKED